MGKYAPFTTLVITCAVALTAPAQAAGRSGLPPSVRCGRALVTANSRVLAVDRRSLGRCVLAIAEAGAPAAAEQQCAVLRAVGSGPDRADRRARRRIEHRCAKALPTWTPEQCPGPGPMTDMAILDGNGLAACAVSSAHCNALDLLSDLFADAPARLSWQHPENLTTNLGGITGNSFESCLTGPPTTTSTTTTTTLMAPTTTLATATTTLPLSTTTLPAVTTTTLAPNSTPNLVITEFMANPAAQSDSAGEYFELWNAANSAVDLDGITVSDLGSNTFSVAGPLVVAPGTYVVFGRSATAANGHVDYVYGSSMSLANSSDQIIVSLDGIEIDRVEYGADTFPVQAGHATVLADNRQDPSANDSGNNWCASGEPLADGDFGSPGALAADCTR